MATMMPFSMTGPWRACALPGRTWMNAPCSDYISILCRRSHTGIRASFTVNGCTLDRSLRADICNSYYCGRLGAYMKTSAAVPVKVIAGEGDKMRTSPMLTP
jgi:hypothetical protein